MTNDSSVRAEASRLLEQITPGEWRVGSSRDIEANCVESNRTMDQDGDWQDGESTVAFTTYDSPHYRADMEAIAALPRLLRALLAEGPDPETITQLAARASKLEDAAFHFQTCLAHKVGDGDCESCQWFAAFLRGEDGNR
jgi:hypothetical protein